MASIWRGYTRILNVHPFKTQVVSTCGLMCIADIMAQQVVEKRGWQKHDIKRTCRQSLIGLFFAGPTLTVWYRTIDRFIKGASQMTAFKKVAADQVLFAPPFTASFFVVTGITTRTEPRKIKERLQKNYIPALLTSYKIWPAVQMANFYLVPLYYRVLVSQFVSIFWNTYLIWKANDHPQDYGGLMCIADIMAQQVVEKRGWQKRDMKRTCRQSLIGLFFAGPTLTVWYRTIDRFIKGSSQMTALKKVAGDQLLFAPPFLAAFFVVTGITKGTEPRKIKDLIQKNYMPALYTSYKIWPAVQIANFYLVPLYYRVLVSQFVSIFWNTYLIWKANDHPQDDGEEERAVTVVAD